MAHFTLLAARWDAGLDTLGSTEPLEGCLLLSLGHTEGGP